MKQKYFIKLTAGERQQLEQLVSSDDASARTLKHAIFYLNRIVARRVCQRHTILFPFDASQPTF